MSNVTLFIGLWVLLTVGAVVFLRQSRKNREIRSRLLEIMATKERWYGRELKDACKDFLSRGKMDAWLSDLEKEGFVASRQESPIKISWDGKTIPGAWAYSLTDQGKNRIEQSRLQLSR